MANCKHCNEEIDLGYGPDRKLKWVHSAGGSRHSRKPFYHEAEPNPDGLTVSKELMDELIAKKQKLNNGKLVETAEDAFAWMIETGKIVGHGKKDSTFFNKEWRKDNK